MGDKLSKQKSKLENDNVNNNYRDEFESNSNDRENREIATFAGGCFWGLQLRFQRVPGVYASRVGYTQGTVDNPSYGAVCSGKTGHTEALQVSFAPSEVTFAELVDIFFDRINPVQANGQGNDHGTQYRTGIYYHSEEQLQVAQAKKDALTQKLKQLVQTEVLPAKKFWEAEEYHQRYLEKKGQSAGKNSSETIRCYG